MSDYTTHNEGVGKTGLVVAAVLIGLFVLVLALLGTGTAPQGDGAAPAAIEQVPTAPAQPTTGG